jgi:FtsP/CotA-like multicopper oxidase with cupredoxin domain
MKRRDFLRTAGLGVAATLAAPRGAFGANASIEGNPLRIPRTFFGDELEAAVSSQEIWPGLLSEVWTFGRSWPAPTIRVRKGDDIVLALVISLREPTSIHWHGLIVPSNMDGHPSAAIAPGGSFRYTFPVVNEAGTYWYHPHPHERTGAQVYMGMAGAIIVEDDLELNLPRGLYDLPLVLQDRFLDGLHELSYAPTSAQRLNGMLGDTGFANGTPDALLAVDAGRYRFRVLNGSNARILRLGFSDGRTFSVIGTDGGLLDAPRAVSSTLLAPAERVEIVVDLSDLRKGDTLVLKSLGYGTATTPGQQGWELAFLTLIGTGQIGDTDALPATLAPFERLDPSSATAEQLFTLDTSPIPLGGHHHKINGVVFDMTRIDATAARDRTELWTITNNHTMPHPIHIHGTQFQIVDRDGVAVRDPRDLGWKDTVQVDGKETVRLLVRFRYDGVYLLHCHNLEHEDDGMMINFAVGAATAVDAEDHVPTELDLR